MKREKQLIVRVSEDEMQLFKDEAWKRRMSLADFVREALRKAVSEKAGK